MLDSIVRLPGHGYASSLDGLLHDGMHSEIWNWENQKLLKSPMDSPLHSNDMTSPSTPLEEIPTGSQAISSGPSENSPLLVNVPAVTQSSTERDNRTRRRQNHALGGIRLAPSPSDDALNAPPLPRSRAGIHGDGVLRSVASRLTDLFSPCLPHRRPARSPTTTTSVDEDNGDEDEARVKLNAIYSYLGESIIVSILSGCCFVHFTALSIRVILLTLLNNS